MEKQAKSPADKAGTGAARAPKFGMDHRNGRIVIGSLRLPLPKSRPARVATGIGLLIGGFLGFLPILGFWMVPLGLFVLSHDLAVVRRWRRRLAVWWTRKRRPAQ